MRDADTGLPEPSTVATIVRIPLPVAFAVRSRTRSGAGSTRTGAREAIDPAAAVTVPAPTTRPAVNVAVVPFAVIRPSSLGVTLHVSVAADGFPKASRTAAEKGRLPRAGTPIGPDSSAMRAGGPAVTVTAWVPAVAPLADAVTVQEPAAASS